MNYSTPTVSGFSLKNVCQNASSRARKRDWNISFVASLTKTKHMSFNLRVLVALSKLTYFFSSFSTYANDFDEKWQFKKGFIMQIIMQSWIFCNVCWILSLSGNAFKCNSKLKECWVNIKLFLCHEVKWSFQWMLNSSIVYNFVRTSEGC